MKFYNIIMLPLENLINPKNDFNIINLKYLVNKCGRFKDIRVWIDKETATFRIDGVDWSRDIYKKERYNK